MDPDGHCAAADHYSGCESGGTKDFQASVKRQNIARAISAGDVAAGCPVRYCGTDAQRISYAANDESTDRAMKSQIEKATVDAATASRWAGQGASLPGAEQSAADVIANQEVKPPCGWGPLCQVGDAAGAAWNWAVANPGAVATAAILIGSGALCVAGAVETAGLACAAFIGAAAGTLGDGAGQQLDHPGSLDFNELAIFTAGGALTGGTFDTVAAPEIGWGLGKRLAFTAAATLATQSTSDLVTGNRTSPEVYAGETGLSLGGVGLEKGQAVVGAILQAIMQKLLPKPQH